jgi:hypothetical protein
MEDRTQLYKQEIVDWLNQEEKDFSAGIELYTRFGHNKALALQMVRKNLLSKLVYELRKIAERPVIRETRTGKERLQKAVEKTKKVIEAKKLRKKRIPAKGKAKPADVIAAKKQELEAEIDRMVEAAKEDIEEIAPAKVKISSTGKEISLNDLPPRLQAKWEENREKYKLMRAWHEKMKLAKTDKERAKCRAELVALDDKIAANWKEIDNYAATGETEDEHEILLTPAEQAKELNACRSFISRNITKVAGLDGTKREELLKKLAERVATLWKYNAEIKEDTRAELAKLGLMTDENKRS